MSQSGLFAQHPIEIGGFRLTTRRAAPMGGKVKVTPAGMTSALEFAHAASEDAPYWIADLLLYAEGREDWRAKLDQIQAATGMAHQTLLNIVHVGRHVQAEARAVAPSFSHAKAVTSLDAADQLVVLQQARDEGLTVSQTAKVVQRLSRPRIIEGQAELSGKFRVILADPPWTYDNSRAMPDGSQTPAASSYEGMTIEAICKVPVEAHALKDAVLFLWSTNSHLLENPGPRDVLEAWGFTYKTNYAWDKVIGRPGHYSYVQHEILIVATRGSCTPDVSILQHDHASIFREKRSGEHSSKPAFARHLIQSLYVTGPYLELFGRKPVEGWQVMGNDARLWKAS